MSKWMIWGVSHFFGNTHMGHMLFFLTTKKFRLRCWICDFEPSLEDIESLGHGIQGFNTESQSKRSHSILCMVY